MMKAGVSHGFAGANESHPLGHSPAKLEVE
jgi:hypothetical protein